MQVIVSDVSSIALFRKRLGNAAFSIKVIGLISAFTTMVYLSDYLQFLVIPLAIFIICFAFLLSYRLKLGETWAVGFITPWVAIFTLFTISTSLKPLNNGIGFDTVIGFLIFWPSIYFAIRGLLALRAYRTNGLTDNRSEFEPLLTSQPWEDGKKGVNKSPFVNKWSLMAYFYLLLGLLLMLFKLVLSAISKGPSRDDPAYLAGWYIVQLFVGLPVWLGVTYLYRRARRHAMLPAKDLPKKQDRGVILYLRSFQDDKKIKIWARANNGRLLLERFIKISFEELVTDHLWRYGNVVGVADPKTKDNFLNPSPLGAAREEMSNDETDSNYWKKVIKEKMPFASVIVAVVPAVPKTSVSSTVWEIDTILQSAEFKSKLILLMPPLNDKKLGHRWTYLVENIEAVTLPENIDFKHTLAVIFQDNEVVTITADKRNEWAYETALDNAKLILEKYKADTGLASQPS